MYRMFSSGNGFLKDMFEGASLLPVMQIF
jgi:hypothetical protein